MLRWLAAANVFALLGILGTGATVRLTASGLGCRHWPGCQPGEPFPQKGYHSYIEFGNRIVAGTVVFVTLAAWLIALVAPSATKRVRRLALVTFLGTFAQAPLGAITVYYDLNPWLVLTHFLLSLVVVTTAALMFLDVWQVRTEAVPRNLYRLALLVAAAGAVLVATGTFATAAGPHPGSADVKRLGSFETAMSIHVRATAIFGVAFAVLAVWLLRRRGGSPGFELVVLGVLLLQMAVGEIQHRADPQWWVVLVHVLLAGTLWAGIVALVASLRPPSRIPG
jgi:cytochrome c oxidase assembly protein subunit 15